MQYKTILVVDDSATSRMIIKRCFEIAGYDESTYHEVADGLKAVAFLRENKVDLILSDLKMPRMDGETLIKKLKLNTATREIPVVVISSMGNEVGDEELKKIGVKAVIQKPLSPEKVLAVLGGAE